MRGPGQALTDYLTDRGGRADGEDGPAGRRISGPTRRVPGPWALEPNMAGADQKMAITTKIKNERGREGGAQKTEKTNALGWSPHSPRMQISGGRGLSIVSSEVSVRAVRLSTLVSQSCLSLLLSVCLCVPRSLPAGLPVNTMQCSLNYQHGANSAFEARAKATGGTRKKRRRRQARKTARRRPFLRKR